MVVNPGEACGYNQEEAEALTKIGIGTMVVNPGGACGYPTGKRSSEILDLETIEVEFIEL